MAKKGFPKRKIVSLLVLVGLLVGLVFFAKRVQDLSQTNNAKPADAAWSEQLIYQVEAESGQITAPFLKKDGYIYQTVNASSVSAGGVAKYNFTAPKDGVYTLRGLIKTQSDGRNSFFTDIDQMPTSPDDIWDTPLFDDFEWKRVSARGNGTFDKNQFVPRYFNLKAGTHQIIVVGREPNTLLDKLQVHLILGASGTPIPTNTPSSSSPQPTGSPTLAPPSGINLIPNGDFETGALNNFRSIQECCSHSTSIVQDPVRSGKYAVRFELNYSDPIVEGSKRVEITSHDTEYNKDYWYRFSVYLPNDWQVDTSREIIDQWHNHPDPGEDYRSPALSLRVDGKNWGLRSVWDDRKITPIDDYDGDIYINLGPYQKGVWTDWTFHVRWSYSGTNGFIEVFKNGTSVYKRTGPNTYNDPTGPYFKFGIYKFDWRTMRTLTTKRVLYQDNVSIIKQ